MCAQSRQEIKLEIGHLLFGDVKSGGHVLIGPTSDKQQFRAFEFGPIPSFAPAQDLFPQGVDNRLFLQTMAFSAARDAARCSHMTWQLPFTTRVRAGGQRHTWSTPFAARRAGASAVRGGGFRPGATSTQKRGGANDDRAG